MYPYRRTPICIYVYRYENKYVYLYICIYRYICIGVDSKDMQIDRLIYRAWAQHS